jgi:hypothetical protein
LKEITNFALRSISNVSAIEILHNDPQGQGVAQAYDKDTRYYGAQFFFIIYFCEVIGTAATPGLLCQPRVIVKMIVENQMECRLAGETEVL